jgi:hypothetical protein
VKVQFKSEFAHISAKFIPENEDELAELKRTMKGAGMQPAEWVDTSQYMTLQVDVEFQLKVNNNNNRKEIK